MTLLGFINKIFKKLAGLAGYNLIIKKKSEVSENYESIFPNATYSPWLSDSLFNEAYKIIKDYTLVDKYRCYELWQLVAETAKLSGALIEIGVWRGGSGALLAKKAEFMGIKDSIYLCDIFKGVAKAGVHDSFYKGGEHADTSVKTVEELIRKLKLNNTKILSGIFPEETGKFVTDNKFRFCHVDVDVYQSAKDIVSWLWPKLVVGGIIVFDDYGFQRCDGVTYFVNKERCKKDKLVIHNLNGHAIIVKLS
jgi:O-methyltransferase